ncbi:amidohydrolase [Microbacterium sp.]|uniref:amidohydrolase n=1 Tax=Microbacterium sp. TaxID=51671 RepID=UPI0039E5AB9D
MHTLDGHVGATHIAVAGGRVLAVGTADDMAVHVTEHTRHESFPCGTIMPGWSDNHSHPVWGLEMTAGARLLEAATLDAVRDALRQDTARSGDWIIGWGLDSNVFAGQARIDGSVFDDIAGGRPLFLRFRDGHSALANSVALERAGVTGEEQFPGASRIVVDPDGVPTGHLLEMHAMARVSAFVAQPSIADRAKRLRGLLEAMAARGITSVHALDAMGDPRELCAEIERTGELPLRLRISPLLQPGITPEEIARWEQLQGSGGRRWNVGGVKLMLDGTVEGGTAWLHHPDTLGEGTEPLWLPPETYREVVLHYVTRGIPTATHAIGDRAVEYALDTLASVPPEIRARVTHRIEHIETLEDDTIARMASLGVIASVQPIHALHLHPDGGDNWTRRLGAERAARAIPTRALAEAGVPIVLGSDWPVADFDPFRGFAAAVSRGERRLAGATTPVPDQSLDRLTALRGYTSTAALARGDADRAGRIAPGYDADLTIVHGDPMTADAEDLHDLIVLATMVGGDLRRVAQAALAPAAAGGADA